MSLDEQARGLHMISYIWFVDNECNSALIIHFANHSYNWRVACKQYSILAISLAEPVVKNWAQEAPQAQKTNFNIGTKKKKKKKQEWTH